MNATLRELLIRDLPPAFVARLADEAGAVYRDAPGRLACLDLPGAPERNYLKPHLRRAMFEGKMFEIAHACGLTTSTERVSSGGHRYNVVRAGRFILTCSRTMSRDVPPRGCEFREQYSDINQHAKQLSLFPIESIPGEGELYCIVIHGPDRQGQDVLGYCCFAFPTPEGTGWIDEPIDVADVRDYQQARYQKADDERAQIQKVEPKFKPGVVVPSAGESA